MFIHIQQLCSNGDKIKERKEESKDVRMSTQENVESLVSDSEGYWGYYPIINFYLESLLC